MENPSAQTAQTAQPPLLPPLPPLSLPEFLPPLGVESPPDSGVAGAGEESPPDSGVAGAGEVSDIQPTQPTPGQILQQSISGLIYTTPSGPKPLPEIDYVPPSRPFHVPDELAFTPPSYLPPLSQLVNEGSDPRFAPESGETPAPEPFFSRELLPESPVEGLQQYGSPAVEAGLPDMGGESQISLFDELRDRVHWR